MPKKYSKKLRNEVVANFESRQAIKKLCQTYKVAQSTIYRWIKEQQAVIIGENVYFLSELNKVVRQKERTNHLLEIIRLSNIISDVPRIKRLEILTDLYEKHDYSVHELCEALDISRGTFYNHIFRRADRTKQIQEQEALLLQVQQIFDDSGQRFGAEKIRFVLAENSVRVGRKRIRAIMEELGLESIRTNAKANFKKRQEYKRHNHLNRKFTTESINLVWVSDITYFKVKGYGMFLCVILDLFSRKIVGYKVARKNSTHIVTATFKRAFNERGNPGELMFHSDRGTQYTSETFHRLLHKCGVKQSFSATARPIDNAVAETFFATFKKEEAYRRDYSSEQDFQKSVDQYIRFYNESRPHQTLGYKTPQRFEELYGKKEAK